MGHMKKNDDNKYVPGKLVDTQNSCTEVNSEGSYNVHQLWG